jgi:outer membrane protein assembly factor BamB
MTFSRFVAVSIVVATCGPSIVTRAQSPGDWTGWRGPTRDGTLDGFAEPAAWPEALTLRWKAEVGTGYATPLVAGNRIYVFSRQGDDEVMSALDVNSGTVIWRTAYAAPFEMQKAASRHGPGPKSTPVLHNGRLYSIGMTGAITAFDAATGKEIWRKPGSQPLTLYTTHAFSPIVDGGVVIFHPGGHDKGALTAFDLATGVERWRWDGDGPSYGSPIVTEFEGVRQLVVATQQKVIGINPASGTLLWERPLVTSSTSNSVTPIRHGSRIIMSSTNLPVIAFTVARGAGRWVTETAWENAEVSYRMSNAVVNGDTLFSLSTLSMGQYFAIDAGTGQTLWRTEGRQAGHAGILRSGNLLFILEDDGELVVARSSRTGFEPLRRYKVADAETWTAPVVSGNRILVKDISTLALWTLN